ncbi:hypothetical protein GE21DRAFT_6675 [Neurospora crassa]|uniref:Uncharacterized protein n=1 Tax=Neurospora crassa (strain ATCC 24698 / 74-OR23-1A / CBS 708.71 / DSM 1257 / FGSC 987) TaxID=367110 RepID=Q7S888_NEUCR|nr:hypothetical protein NCU05255 [Neurospora crassa OR74A]EAA32556.2 hypothetical protein NCU05255 [Neurospora crassa OR74A]KHE85355.1 hypothetical protein GE21DRAFT_6675 [Neurospora crassa]|eukprot:XP_961792.2 hypothetical protein NCU05255 [Neurospora crassa OR74A]
MPTYLCHGFRWQRRSIRVYTVVQDLDDVSPEWLIRPTSSRCLLQSFYNLFEFLPYCSPHEPETWDSNEDEDEDEDEDEGDKSGEENGEEEAVVVPGSRGSRGEKGSEEQRTQWPKRKESLGVLRGHGSEGTTGKGMGTMGKEMGKGMGKEKREITAIPVGSNNRSSISRTRTISRSPSLRLPLQGVRTPSRTRLQTTAAAAASAATTPTTPTAPTAAIPAPASTPALRTASTSGVSSAGKGRKGKTTGNSSSSRRSESHSPNRKKDELSAQRWSAVKVLEEYDPNNLDEVSRPYAYVADHVVRVDGAADILAEVRRGGSGGSGEYHDALEHLEESAKEKEETWIEQLRDELQRGEEIKWYVVVNGDEERNYSNPSDSDDEDEDEDEDESEIPIIMVTPTRSTFPDETETETAGAVGEKRMVEQPQQPQPQPQQQQHQHHQQQQPQQPQPQPHPQPHQHHQINETEPGPRRGSTASANPDMGTITSTTVPLTSSFSLDTSPSNAPTPTTIPALSLKPLKPPKKQSTLPTLPTISTSSLYLLAVVVDKLKPDQIIIKSPLRRRPRSWSRLVLGLLLGLLRYRHRHRDRDKRLRALL